MKRRKHQKNKKKERISEHQIFNSVLYFFNKNENYTAIYFIIIIIINRTVMTKKKKSFSKRNGMSLCQSFLKHKRHLHNFRIQPLYISN